MTFVGTAAVELGCPGRDATEGVRDDTSSGRAAALPTPLAAPPPGQPSCPGHPWHQEDGAPTRSSDTTRHPRDLAIAALREALTAVGYLFGERADSLMHAVRQLIGRAQTTPQEVKLLHGLARQLLWAAGQMRKPPDGVAEGE